MIIDLLQIKLTVYIYCFRYKIYMGQSVPVFKTYRIRLGENSEYPLNENYDVPDYKRTKKKMRSIFNFHKLRRKNVPMLRAYDNHLKIRFKVGLIENGKKLYYIRDVKLDLFNQVLVQADQPDYKIIEIKSHLKVFQIGKK